MTNFECPKCGMVQACVSAKAEVYHACPHNKHKATRLVKVEPEDD